MYPLEKPLVPSKIAHNIQYLSDLDTIWWWCTIHLYGMVWAHETREGVFGDPVVILSLEGNIIIAQYQQQLYTFHKWRERQHGVGHLAYHVQICIPPKLQEPKVEEHFHELPFWRVTQFVWMIAWGLELHMGRNIPNNLLIPCLKKASRPHIVASMDIPLLQDRKSVV